MRINSKLQTNQKYSMLWPLIDVNVEQKVELLADLLFIELTLMVHKYNETNLVAEPSA